MLENCYTYNTKSSGIVFAYGSNIVVDGNTVEKSCNGGTQEGISICVIHTFEVMNNTVSNGLREGIDAKDGCTNGRIYNNHVSNCGENKTGIYVDAYSGYQSNIEVYGNTVTGCHKGICVATENNGLLDNVKIHDNITYDCNWGLALGDWGKGSTHDIQNIFFYNNTAYNMIEAGVFLCNDKAKNIVISNNIFSGAQGKPIHLWSANGNLNETKINHNLLNKIGSSAATSPTGTDYLVGDPVKDKEFIQKGTIPNFV